MKTASFFLLILTVLLSIENSQSAEKLQLKLEEGQTVQFKYLYNWERDRQLWSNDNNYEYDLQTDFEFVVTEKLNANKFTIELWQNRVIYTSYFKNAPEKHFDSKYPPSNDSANQLKLVLPHFSDKFDRFKIKMEINLEKNDLVLLNSEELVNEILKSIQNREISEQGLRQNTNQSLENIKNLVKDYLLRFNNATYQTKDSLKLNTSDYIVSRKNHRVKLSKHTFSKDDQTEYTADIVIDEENGLILESTEKTVTPGKKQKKGERSEVKTYLLIKNSLSFNDEIIVRGHIEYPKSKRVQFQVLKAPALTDREIYRATLDSTNHFSIRIPFEKEGFVFMTNAEDERMIWSSPTIIIYAEPGNSIDFDLKGKKVERTVIHKGDMVAENSIFSNHKTPSALRINNFFWRVQGPILSNADSVSGLKALEDFTKYIKSDPWDEKLKAPDLSLKFKEYFLNEMMMHKLDLACTILNFSKMTGDRELNPKTDAAYAQLKLFADQFEVCRYFQESGYFSRQAVDSYIHYIINDYVRYSNSSYSGPFLQNLFRLNPERANDLLEQVLAGSALTQGKAIRLHQNLNSSPTKQSDLPDWFKNQKQFTQNIITSSNDSALNQQVAKELEKAEKLFNGEIFTRKLFLTPSGDSASISDFFGKKPCVICPARDWAQNRYFFDDLAKKYPEINAIIINEGDDFSQWQNYLKRAEPVAIQLFLKTGSGENLNNLFFNYNPMSHVILIDRYGKLLEFKTDIYLIENYLHDAMYPPKEPKELSKSSLYAIIWVMAGAILMALIAFLIFKARMRTKLRKQNQEKRLRELQLSAIRAQMNPHFLFNSLNSVQNLVQKNQGREAHLYLADFAGLIRKVLKNSQQEEVSLSEELETLGQYIKLEQLRFDFEFELFVDPEVDQNHFMVPSMILQPIAENAILHGLQHKKDNRKLRVEVLKKELAIQINMEDNGIGMEASREMKSNSNGIGLNLNIERLQLMEEKYGGHYSFKLIDLTQVNKEGTQVKITIPEEE